LELSPDDIFYPENAASKSELNDLFNMIRRCNKHQLIVIEATVKALINNSEQ
jgi:hypothetical protein